MEACVCTVKICLHVVNVCLWISLCAELNVHVSVSMCVHMLVFSASWKLVCVFVCVCLMGNKLTWIRLGERVSVQQVSEKQENRETH